MLSINKQGALWSVLGVLAVLLLPLRESLAYSTAKEEQGVGSNDMQVVALESLQLQPGAIRLTGTQNEATLTFPLSSRQRVSDMTLALFVTNSISLVDRSQIAVSINGSVIGQVAFKAETPETRVRMTIPAQLLKSGYNKLTFSVAQHYSTKCEDPSAPELWSEIDTQRSNLSFRSQLRSIEPLLSELPSLIDKRLNGNYLLTIATTGTPDDQLLESGGLVSQAAALSRDYAPVAIRHTIIDAAQAEDGSLQSLAQKAFGDSDGVLLGSRDELAKWLDKPTYERASAPLLALFAVGAQQDHFVLVVSGADHAQVRQAAASLAMAYDTMPPSSHANIGEIAAMQRSLRPTLQSGVKQPLSAFGYSTVTRQGIYPENIRIRFWVPADRFAKPNSELNLHLHMAYGAGLGLQSTIDLFLNDHFEQAVRLSERLGAVYYDYRLPIPINSLAPGWNELRLRPNLMPERDGGECQPTYTGNLLFTLFDDSYMEADEMGQLTLLPDLKLLGRTAFPFSGGRDSKALSLALTSRDSGNVAAAWTLLAKLAQVNSSAILDTRVQEPAQASGNVLLVGQLQGVPDVMRAASPLNRDGWLRLGSQAAATSSLFPTLISQAHAAEGEALELSMGDLLKSSLLITQFESPHESGKSIVMVLSDSTELLASSVESLTTPQFWGQLAQGTAVLRSNSAKLLTYQPSSQFMVGNAGSQARLSMAFEHRPLLAIVAVLGGLMLFTLLTWGVLRRYRQRHHKLQGG